MGDLGDGRDIEDIGHGVAEGLAVEGLRIRLDGVLPGLRIIRVLDEGNVDAQALERDGKEGGGAAVEARRGHDVVAGRGEIQNSRGFGGLAGSEGDGRDAALEGGEALFQRVLGGVGQAGVDGARVREVEAVGRVLGVVKDVGGGLVNRHVAGIVVPIEVLAGVEGAGGEGPVGIGVIVFRRHAWQD